MLFMYTDVPTRLLFQRLLLLQAAAGGRSVVVSFQRLAILLYLYVRLRIHSPPLVSTSTVDTAVAVILLLFLCRWQMDI